jgi:hypothetical protein
MNSARTYATAGAFRTALEERLRHIAKAEQVDVNRLRRQVSFDRSWQGCFRPKLHPGRSRVGTRWNFAPRRHALP